ncbi:hypothetical protein PG989_003716 [Apiospora arundinis]
MTGNMAVNDSNPAARGQQGNIDISYASAVSRAAQSCDERLEVEVRNISTYAVGVHRYGVHNRAANTPFGYQIPAYSMQLERQPEEKSPFTAWGSGAGTWMGVPDQLTASDDLSWPETVAKTSAGFDWDWTEYLDPQLYTTTHTAEGKPTFATSIPEEANFLRTPLGVDINACYTSEQVPVPLGQDVDLAQHAAVLSAGLGAPHSLPQGAMVRYIDFHPQGPVLWHRSVTVDIGVVVEGEMELMLLPTEEEQKEEGGSNDKAGETRILRRGDVFVQRSTNHAWRNPSATEYARMFCVVLGAEPVVIDGKPLEASMSIYKPEGEKQEASE